MPLFVSLRAKLQQVTSSVFGDVSWRPPAWLTRTTGALRLRRKSAGAAGFTLLLLVGLGWWIHQWYEQRPKPQTVAVTADPVPLTRLEKELKPAPLLVRFSASVAPLESIGKAVPKGIHLEPKEDGVWRWTHDRVLAFYPTHDWPAETTYKIRLDKRMVARHVLLDRSEIEVKTPSFVASLKQPEFYQHPEDPAVKQVVATIEFTHRVDPKELEQRLTVLMVGGSDVFKSKNEPRFTVTYGLHHRVAHLRTTPLALPPQEDFMKVLLRKGVTTTQGGAGTGTETEMKVRVPDLYSFFRIDSIEGKVVADADGQPEQVLVVNTTAATKSEEIAKELEVSMLPPKRSIDGAEGEKWLSASEVDEPTRALATPVATRLIPAEHETSKLHTFKIKVEAEGSLYLKIGKGIKAVGDYQLREDYISLLPVPELKPEIAFEARGGVLALNGERKISVRSRGVSVIEYVIARVPADQINHLVSQTGGEFQAPEFQSSMFDEENIARVATERQGISLTNRYAANYSSFDFSNHLAPATDGGSAVQGLFFLKAREWHPPRQKRAEGADQETGDGEEENEEEEGGEEDYDLRGAGDRRFILVTDLGILMKENGDGSRDVFLTSIRTGDPRAAVRVDVLAKNGVPLVTGTTGADGRVTFGSLGDPRLEKKPVAVVARHGDDVAFMPFDREDRQLDFSRFEIDGVESMSGTELDAYVFTERGIYRPGDEINAGIIVKQRDWAGELAGLPVELEIIDARGRAAGVQKLSLSKSGFVEASHQTAYESPSGTYTLNLHLLREGKRDLLLGSGSVTVKEFLPDRMKITSRLSKQADRGWVTPEEIRASITLHNLYGTPAADHRVSGRLRLSPAEFRFADYKDYTFCDRLREAKEETKSHEIELGDRTTDSEGDTVFQLQLERFADATYQMWFSAEGFEAAGGRSVASGNSVLISPLPYVVGYKADGDLKYVAAGSARSVEFIALDAALSKIPVEALECSIIERAYVSILKKQENGNLAYDSVLRERTVKTERLSIAASGVAYPLPAEAPGNYVLELRDGAGARVSKVSFTVVGRGSVDRSLEKNAELELKLSKGEYAAGEEIELSVVAPYSGFGLITIERDKVYAHQWFETGHTSSLQRIRIPEDFEGTGYVNVAFIRRLDSKEVFLSPLSYGVVPFKANFERRRLAVELQCAEKARPGEPLKISYRTNQPAKIVIFAVDEGILQVTDYELPDPLGYFFRKCALTVQTTQIVDLIMPEFSLWRSMSAPGGDGDARLNPFKRVTEKPVVFWSHIIDAGPEQREVIYDVPDYFDGTLRVMAVAVSPDAVGSAGLPCLIRGPFVITPAVPTVAAPGDAFEVGVTVANGLEESGANAEIILEIEPSEHLEVTGAPARILPISQGRELTTTISVRVKEKLGSATLVFRATLGSEQVARRSTLSIRPSVPFMTQIRSGTFAKKALDVAVTRRLHPDYRKLEASLSVLPLGLARGLDYYLKEYPHGCTEQITSGAFCRLLLADEVDFGLSRADVHAQLERTFATLTRRQNDKGAFGYWASEKGPAIDFVTVYVMHFLTEAKAAGFVPPAEMFKLGLRYLQTMVGQEPRGQLEGRTLAYAIYVLTREGIVTTNYILNLRDSLDRAFGDDWHADLTGAYLAGACSMLKKQAEARTLVRRVSFGQHKGRVWNDFYQPLGADAQYIAILARHFPDLLKKISPEEFQSILGPLSAGNFSTLSAAYAVGALKSYSESAAASAAEFHMSEVSTTKSVVTLQAEGTRLQRASFSASAESLRFAVAGSIPGLGTFYQVTEAGYDLSLPNAVLSDGLEIHRELLDNDGRKSERATLGKPVTVRVRVRSTTQQSVTNVAIVDLLPGAFEIVSGSLRPGAGTVAGMDYVEVREDRAVFFGTIGPEVKEITYQIKGTNLGEFVVPPIFAESMYDRSIRARGLGGRITVVAPK